MIKRILYSCLGSLAVVGCFWFGGFDFNTRGETALLCYFLSLLAFVYIYFSPSLEK